MKQKEKEIGELVVKAAEAVDYTNLGYCRIPASRFWGNFILLRLTQDLQVEHPISEMVSGLDFVKLTN